MDRLIQITSIEMILISCTSGSRASIEVMRIHLLPFYVFSVSLSGRALSSWKQDGCSWLPSCPLETSLGRAPFPSGPPAEVPTLIFIRLIFGSSVNSLSQSLWQTWDLECGVGIEAHGLS